MGVWVGDGGGANKFEINIKRDGVVGEWDAVVGE